MDNNFVLKNIIFILKISLVIALLCSFYIYIYVIILKKDTSFSSYVSWQFPMILALVTDIYLMK
jgi:hypothetical protein